MLKIKPLNNHILIERDSTEDVTASGIVTTQIQGDRTESWAIRGTIVEIPNGLDEDWQETEKGLKRRTPLKVSVGDRVLVKKWNNQLVNLEGRDYLLTEYDDIIGQVYEEE